MGNAFSLNRMPQLQSLLIILATHPQFVSAWNDHYDKEDDAWVMKIFFPIIAALILLCLGSCGYANYCKQPVEHNEDEEVDRHEEVYSLSKPDRPYLTPHYQRRTFQPPPPAYDNHAFRPGAAPQAPAVNNGPKQITASSVYQGHTPMGAPQTGPNRPFGMGPGAPGANSYSQFQPQQFNQQQYGNHTIKPNPIRSQSFQVPQQNDIYGERSKSLWDMPQNQHQKPAYPTTSGRASPIQSTRSAPAGVAGLRRTFSSPNLTPSQSNGSFNPYGAHNQYDQFNQPQNNQFGQSRHQSMNYGGRNPYQRTPSPASSSSTYIPAASEVGSTAPLFSRRRSPNNGHGGMYDSQSGFGGGGGAPRQMGGNNMARSYQDFNQRGPMGRSFEMEDIYGGRGGGNGQMNQQFGMNQYPPHPQQNQHFNQQPNQFQNQFQDSQFGQQPGFNQQQNQFQDNQFGQQGGQSIYEHLTPQQYPPQDPYQGQTNMAYDPYDTNNTNLPGY